MTEREVHEIAAERTERRMLDRHARRNALGIPVVVVATAVLDHDPLDQPPDLRIADRLV